MKRCRCRICRMHTDLGEITVRLNVAPDLSPETLKAIETIVKAAFRKAKKSQMGKTEKQRAAD